MCIIPCISGHFRSLRHREAVLLFEILTQGGFKFHSLMKNNGLMRNKLGAKIFGVAYYLIGSILVKLLVS